MALPDHRLTLLFTDVESSTWLLERLGPARYGDVLRRHHRLVRDAVVAHGGREVGTEGDAFFVVFERASDALDAAAAIQRSLALERWPDGVAVAVRMGLHSGEARLVDGEYVGMDVHRAARVCAAAHGGQVLMSDAVRRAVVAAGMMSPPARDLGEHRLKDLPEAVQLHQLWVEGLPTDFPPPRSLGAHPTNLPPQPAALIGRDRDLAAASALLGRPEVRLLTVTGPGGVGKTRFALQLAVERLQDFGSGAFVVYLAAVLDEALIVPMVAQALSVRERPGESLEDALHEHLRGTHLLLLLDNLEQLTGAARVVGGLLASAPRLRILATSRAPVGVAGEHEYALDSLAHPDAARLFSERARAVRPDLDLAEGASASVAEICRRLDGLPLAIELAAARLRVLTPEAMLARLDGRLRLLTSGPRDRAPRQQTLRATIAWSHDLLAESEATLFRRLAVFAGGFSLDAVEAVCGAGEALDGIESLLAQSLVRRGRPVRGEPRFFLLETIREYAVERLEQSGEGEVLRHRHADHMIELVERSATGINDGRQREWLERLDADFENLRAAAAWAQASGDDRLELRLAGAIWDYSWVRRGWEEIRGWVEHALEADRGHDPRLRLWALRTAAEIEAYDRRSGRAAELAEELLALADALGDLRARAHGLAALGVARGADPEAAELFRECADLCRRVDDRHQLGWALNNLGDAHLRGGRPAEAAEHFRAAAAIGEQEGFDDIGEIAMGNLAYVELATGDLRAARALMRRALPMTRALRSPDGVMYALELFAATDTREARPERAARLLGAAEALREEIRVELQPFEVTVHDEAVAQLREELGSVRCHALWQAGRALSTEAALELATAADRADASTTEPTR